MLIYFASDYGIVEPDIEVDFFQNAEIKKGRTAPVNMNTGSTLLGQPVRTVWLN